MIDNEEINKKIELYKSRVNVFFIGLCIALGINLLLGYLDYRVAAIAFIVFAAGMLNYARSILNYYQLLKYLGN